MIHVKCIGVDERGKIKLSRRAAMKERDEAAQAAANGGSAPAPEAPQA
jgi:polyribonucleotide nucleotidyltransferase